MDLALETVNEQLEETLTEVLEKYLSSQKDVPFSNPGELEDDFEKWLEDQIRGFIDGTDWDELFEPWRDEDEDEDEE